MSVEKLPVDDGPSTTVMRAVQRLKLPSLWHGLLCLPRSYLDCTTVVESLEDVVGTEKSACLSLRLATAKGKLDIRGYGSSWKEALPTPSIKNAFAKKSVYTMQRDATRQ